MVPYPNAIGGSHVQQSPLADCERTINYYLEKSQAAGAKSKAQLYPTPGVRPWLTTTGLMGRGIFEMDNHCFVAIGDQILELTDQPPAATLRGTVVMDQYPVTFSNNGPKDDAGEMFITSGNNGYILDLTTNVFTQVRTGGTRQGGMLDTFFLALDADTHSVYLSDLNKGTVWDPTQVIRRTIMPDPWIAMTINYRELWLFGEQTSEVWYNADSFPIPYQPHPSGLIPYGIAAPFSVRNIGGTLLWLAKTAQGTGMVVQANGFQPQIVSTHAMKVAIASYPRIDDAIGDSVQIFGHTFYILTFPSAGATWVYDLSTQEWVEWLTWMKELNEYVAWRPLFHAVAFNDNKHLICDRGSGVIYELTHEVAFDVEHREQRRLRRFPGLINGLERVFYTGLQVYLESGLPRTKLPTVEPESPLIASSSGGTTTTSPTGLGFKFTPLVPLTITSLGVWKFPGNQTQHVVYLRNAAYQELRRAYLDFRNGQGTVNAFNYGLIPTIPLTPGTIYYLYNYPYDEPIGVDAQQMDLDVILNTGIATIMCAAGDTGSSNLDWATPGQVHGPVNFLCTGSSPTVEPAPPQMSMRISNDAGKTWGPERWRTAGRIGEYRTRVDWTRCGSARDRVFEVVSSDPIPWRIVDAYLDIGGK
jgi:hypothetical protein